MNIVITRQIPDVAAALLRAAGHEVTIAATDHDLSPLELLAASAHADGLIALLTNKINAAFLDQRPNIKAIANFAVGYNNIDIVACTARKIGVSNTPGVLTDATAEIAFALLIAAARRTGEAERMVRARQWTGWAALQLMGKDVVGQTLGIIGAGRIGTRLARMTRGFGMPLIYFNRRPNPEMEQLGAKLLPLDDLLRQSDFISIHVPLSAETRHLIGSREFGLMKPHAILINTSRGPIVDEAALVEALTAQKIFAAGLDVYENEPTLHPGLYALENVVLLPHIGSATASTRNKMAEMAATNLLSMLQNRRPPNPVNPEIWP